MARTGRPRVEWVTLTCAACGKPVQRRATDMARRKTDRVFCSKACRGKLGSKPRRKPDATCLTCGKVFYPGSGNKGMYCSVACHNIAQKRREQRACDLCGALFEVRPSQRERRFCSRECAGRATWRHMMDRIHNGKPAFLTTDGHVKVWEPDRKPSWVLEHRLVMEQKMGRELRSDEHVHHLNGDKADNRPENLIVMGHGEHSSITNSARLDQIERDRQELERYRALYGPLPKEGTE